MKQGEEEIIDLEIDEDGVYTPNKIIMRRLISESHKIQTRENKQEQRHPRSQVDEFVEGMEEVVSIVDHIMHIIK